MKYQEDKICKELINKYSSLKEYQIKGKTRLKTQKSSTESILKIITNEEDKIKFYEYMNSYNSRRGKKPFKVITAPQINNAHEGEGEEEGEEEEVEEEVEEKAVESDTVEKENIHKEKSLSKNNELEKMKKQRDNVLKKLNKLQEMYDNLYNLHNDFKIDYKEVCNERNKLQLAMEKKGWNKDLRKEFDKYKSFYQKYANIVE